MLQHIKDFKVAYVDLPDYPYTRKLIYLHRRVIYINTASRPDANVIRLVYRNDQTIPPERW